MSDIVCKNCGASNDAGRATCPYCKSSLAESAGHRGNGGKGDTGLSGITRLYLEGKLEQALSLVNVAIKERPSVEEDVSFLMLHAKLLIESEAPNAKIRGVLSKAFLIAPKNLEVMDYMEIIDAKEKLEFVSKKLGEEALEKVIRRSPKNPHAHFLLGAHLFWIRNSPEQALRHLEQCVGTRPNMLRAWACLGALHRLTGHEELARRAFRRCVELETNPQRITYFKSLLGEAA